MRKEGSDLVERKRVLVHASPVEPLFVSSGVRSSAMQNSRLSIELCELVIDFIQEPGPWWDLTWWMLQNDPAILVKYTCICSAWLPRARRVLYHTIKFRKPSQVDLFIRSITENPSLANAVHDLIITPKGERTYIPFVHHTLVTRLRRLRTLMFYFDCGQKWVFPPRHHELVAMLPVTNLVIMYPSDDHRVWSGVFRLIYSLRNLQALHIYGPTSYGKPRFDTTRRPSWVCSKLRTLVLTGASQIDNLPKRAMGNVKQLALYNFDLAEFYTTASASSHHWRSCSCCVMPKSHPEKAALLFLHTSFLFSSICRRRTRSGPL
ncbi:hypothetical protein C8T65DRAFT_234447 [Cerioporus squamosus]|nr:hypothetical protein C8T65DRAFT_234447 [Cerioporus squamosus]